MRWIYVHQQFGTKQNWCFLVTVCTECSSKVHYVNDWNHGTRRNNPPLNLRSFFFIILSNSWVLFIRQNPFSYVGPNIFHKTFLSKNISLLFTVSFNIHVSHAYVTTGIITEKCNFSFAFLEISLLWNIFLFAKKALFPRAITKSYVKYNTCIKLYATQPGDNKSAV